MGACHLVINVINEDCELQNCYIGQTDTTLSRRLTMHLASGGPKQHHQEVHHATLTRKELVDNTKIIRTERDTYRLSILESLLIKKVKPITLITKRQAPTEH